MPPKDIPSYVEWVIEQKPELKNTPDDIKANIRDEMSERLSNLVNAAILAAMPPAELDHFERLLIHGTQDDIQNFCEKVIPDMDEIVARVLIEFRTDYLGV